MNTPEQCRARTAALASLAVHGALLLGLWQLAPTNANSQGFASPMQVRMTAMVESGATHQVRSPPQQPLIARELPAHASGESSVHMARESPAHIDRESPAHVARELPAHIGRESPAHIGRELPAHSSSELPAAAAMSDETLTPAGSGSEAAESARESVATVARSMTRDSDQRPRKGQPDYAYNPVPDYPMLLREQGVGGVVWLRVWVEASGRPGEIAIVQGSGHHLLDESALRAVRRWRFLPAHNGQQALASWVEFPIRFSSMG